MLRRERCAEHAHAGLDLKGVVSFHGGLNTQQPAQEGTVKARILVCNGADDPLVSAESIAEFKEEMTGAKAEFEFKNYEGATHSFTNPNADAVAKEFGMPVRVLRFSRQGLMGRYESFFWRWRSGVDVMGMYLTGSRHQEVTIDEGPATTNP